MKADAMQRNNNNYNNRNVDQYYPDEDGTAVETNTKGMFLLKLSVALILIGVLTVNQYLIYTMWTDGTL